ncbi:MAG: helix-turn-helix domain-containing protein, partial [Candidatus Omnitrophota bacterium]|nr:helix-turn-helix domain-containing protein [Candidatus Omnitrophota bacterium]
MGIKRKPKFRHLTQKDRNQIDVLARRGYTLQRIAKKVGCHWSTISRELRRNLSKEHKEYVASIAQAKTINRKVSCVKKSKFDNPALVAY